MLVGAGLSARENISSPVEVRIIAMAHGSQREICKMRIRR